MLHLAAAGLGFAQIADAHGEAIDLGGDGAEIVARTPLDARLEVSFADAPRAFRDLTQRHHDCVNGERGEDQG